MKRRIRARTDKPHVSARTQRRGGSAPRIATPGRGSRGDRDTACATDGREAQVETYALPTVGAVRKGSGSGSGLERKKKNCKEKNDKKK